MEDSTGTTIQAYFAGLTDPRVERTKLQFNILYVCIGWRGRALSLLWRMLGPGASSFAEQKEVLEVVTTWLPQKADVLLLGDREFGTGILAQWALAQGWGVCLRLRAHEYGCRAGARHFERLLLVLPGECRFWPHATFTQNMRSRASTWPCIRHRARPSLNQAA